MNADHISVGAVVKLLEMPDAAVLLAVLNPGVSHVVRASLKGFPGPPTARAAAVLS